ncbi:YchJ family protein [Affinibrenneria salicis]|uniref:UPF0225 protein FJU30_05855 n=1 Tax=Affinibrenneria salicis TaxID=2590031 RepID=A0A5J5G463_9GAMM|nr:YchJ family protein [Affinibrenneria salicis]KAA9001810.1 YchJ family protein [Affinibrenneria salicis]
MSELCPCGSQLQYIACCQPYLGSGSPAPDPVALMRSRYTAYCKHDVDYLIATWHPDCRPEQWRASLSESGEATVWQGLTILAETPGKNSDEAFVEFAARFTDAERPGQTALMRERSRFLRLHDRWYYIDGVHLQTGRNDRCPCGSGKKFKKCCGQ